MTFFLDKLWASDLVISKEIYQKILGQIIIMYGKFKLLA